MTGAGMVLLSLGLSGCDIVTGRPYGKNPSGEVTLPEATRRIDPAAERGAQLKTTTYTDDHPELTGAPDPHGRWPAKVGRTRSTAYKAKEAMIVGSEGPGAVTP
ncbi:MAG: hypothetical protein ACK5JR_06075 [Tropicimonas sp.]|uniref:hypothetical protein n=1 Tax=Tropicimonas sp. TaxID=2067044 RepID=UPI003A835D5D